MIIIKMKELKMIYDLRNWPDGNIGHLQPTNEVVDAFIDIIVIALGTLDAFDVNIKKAWKRVHYANMQKKIGVKDTRPNPLGLPDLVKPKDWQAPQHFDNIGKLDFLDKE